jgi:hypothetical protein
LKNFEDGARAELTENRATLAPSPPTAVLLLHSMFADEKEPLHGVPCLSSLFARRNQEMFFARRLPAQV